MRRSTTSRRRLQVLVAVTFVVTGLLASPVAASQRAFAEIRRATAQYHDIDVATATSWATPD